MISLIRLGLARAIFRISASLLKWAVDEKVALARRDTIPVWNRRFTGYANNGKVKGYRLRESVPVYDAVLKAQQSILADVFDQLVAHGR